MGDSEAPGVAVDEFVGLLSDFLLRVMAPGASRAMHSYAALDLSLVQVRIMLSLSRSESAMTISEVAVDVGLSLVTTGRSVDRLVTESLVDRREDSRDRRVKRVSLTPRGAQVVADQLDLRREGLRSFTEQLSPGDRTTLAVALRSVLDGQASAASAENGSCSPTS